MILPVSWVSVKKTLYLYCTDKEDLIIKSFAH
jgi:hypothetical protein